MEKVTCDILEEYQKKGRRVRTINGFKRLVTELCDNYGIAEKDAISILYGDRDAVKLFFKYCMQVDDEDSIVMGNKEDQ